MGISPDTSSTTPFATPMLVKKLLAACPPERILFGTDWPLYDPLEERQRIQQMGGLSDSMMDRILSNATALPGLLDLLAALSHHSAMSLGCYCEDEARCHRSVLRALRRRASMRRAGDFASARRWRRSASHSAVLRPLPGLKSAT